MPDARRNLVIVRAGKTSLHRQWIAGAAERTWDLVVSTYTTEARDAALADEQHHAPGGKWNGLFKTICQLSRPIESYDYVWLPDDDIAASCADIEILFSEMARYQLLIAQPSLTANSFYTYPHTLRCHFTHIRFTDMVELMVPCFDAQHLRGLLPLFAATATGWGLDWVWCRSAPQNRKRYAVLDSVAVYHTRPLGNHLYEHAESIGENASAYMERFLARFPDVGLDFKPTCYASMVGAHLPLNMTLTMALLALSYAIKLQRSEGRPCGEALRQAMELFAARSAPVFDQLML